MHKRLRNLFDRYSQQENHLTHSLLLVLNQNRHLLDKILKEIGVNLSKKQVNLLTQVAQAAQDKTSVPDGYIYTEDYRFCIGIETKIYANTLKLGQLRGHLEQLSQYERSILLVLTPDESEPAVVRKLKESHNNLHFLSWMDLLTRMSEIGPDKGKNDVGLYLFHEFMAYVERSYHMTPFTGFNFRDGYDTGLAVHYIKKISEIITPYIRQLYPDLKKTRPMINAPHGNPWQSWYPTENVQDSVHLTLSITPVYLNAFLVLGNGCRYGWKKLRAILQSERKNFRACLLGLLKSKQVVGEALIIFQQRHFEHRTLGIRDAVVTLNAAMLLGKGKAKENTMWWELMENLAATKNKYNYQMSIGYEMNYESLGDLKTPNATILLERCYKNLMPVYELIAG
ncbi:MAG: PD-(D/E)XK nuclease family protein [Pseudomonadota bacterium]